MCASCNVLIFDYCKYRAVETFIRNKYEHKKYAKKDGMPPKANVQENTSTSTKISKSEKVGGKLLLKDSGFAV